MSEVDGTEKEWPSQLILLSMGFLGPEQYVAESIALQFHYDVATSRRQGDSVTGGVEPPSPPPLPAPTAATDASINIDCGPVSYDMSDLGTLPIYSSKEFGYKVTAFHHAVESYKIADILAEEGICSAIWADWWGFKMEAYDAIPENAALLQQAGACVIIHSDDENQIQRLNQEAAKAQADGRAMGIEYRDGLGSAVLFQAVAAGDIEID